MLKFAYLGLFRVLIFEFRVYAVEVGRVSAIIVAAGTGTRMGSQGVPKQFLELQGVPILVHTLTRFDTFSDIDHILLIVRPEDRHHCEELLRKFHIKKVDAIIEGGQERQDSVFHGLKRVNRQTEIVVIHDAVRVFVTQDIVTDSIRAARKYGASVVAVPTKDTIKTVRQQSRTETEGKFVDETLERKRLWQVQTPQTFQYPLIWSVYQKAHEIGLYGTDDAMLMEYFDHAVNIVQGSYRNIKITTPDDLLIAQVFLEHEKELTRKHPG